VTPRPTARRFIVAVALLVALVTLAGLTGCWEGSVLSQEAEWAEGIQTYRLSSRGIADRFLAADQVILDLADKAQAREQITEDDLKVAYEANTAMTKADQDWLDLAVPVQELYAAHMAIEQAMREVRAADKELVLAIESDTMSMVSDANADRAAGVLAVEEALAEQQAWYDDNERRIERGLR